MNSDLFKEYLRHFIGKSQFIVEVGFPFRVLVLNVDEIITVLNDIAVKQNKSAYVTVFMYGNVARGERRIHPDYSRAVIDKIPFETDDITRLWAIRTLANDIPCRTYFSGKKGYHVYIDLTEPVSSRFLSWAQTRIRQKYQIPIDPTCVGDLARFLKIPYTRHCDTGRYVIPFKPNWSRELITGIASSELKPKDVWSCKKEPISPKELERILT